MTFVAVSIAVETPGDVGPAIEQARGAVDAGARLIEWRIDGLANEQQPGEGPSSGDAMLRLIADGPAPCIVTCRPAWEGGSCEAPEEVRASLFEAALTADTPPKYIDVELLAIETPGPVREVLEQWSAGELNGAAPDRTGLIVSSHDFEGRPADLLQRIESAVRLPVGDVLKLAWRARSLRDNLQAFEILADRHMPTIALCMGQFGLMSRVLAGKFGGLLTFATTDPENRTASGQPTVHELIDRYHADRIDGATRVYGVIGWPVEHSRGPIIHNAGFEATGHNGVYLPLPIPAEYEHFKATVAAMLDARFAGGRSLDFRGASVTIPHKTHLIDFVRESGGTVDDDASAIGAANTLVVGDDGSLRCLNTDARAVVDALCVAMEIDADAIADHRVAILGAGGMARASAAAVSRLGAPTVLFNRTPANAAAVAEALHGRPLQQGQGFTEVAVGDPASIDCDGFDIIINCTSIGMEGGPMPDASPLDALAGRPVELTDEIAVLDTVYTPLRTPLLTHARDAGATAIDGRLVFLHQAARQFEAWVGSPAPLDVFDAAFNAPEDAGGLLE